VGAREAGVGHHPDRADAGRLRRKRDRRLPRSAPPTERPHHAVPRRDRQQRHGAPEHHGEPRATIVTGHDGAGTESNGLPYIGDFAGWSAGDVGRGRFSFARVAGGRGADPSDDEESDLLPNRRDSSQRAVQPGSSRPALKAGLIKPRQTSRMARISSSQLFEHPSVKVSD